MGWKNWIKAGIVGWLIGLVLGWIILIILDVSDGVYFQCSAIVTSYGCNFIGFFFNGLHWIVMIVYTFPAFILGVIIGRLYEKYGKIKYWPCWLNGGIITSIIYGISFLVLLYLSPTGIDGYFFPLLNFIALLNCNSGFFCNQIIGIILTFISYFLIGSIIGWLYGKIKSKNQPQLNQNF